MFLTVSFAPACFRLLDKYETSDRPVFCTYLPIVNQYWVTGYQGRVMVYDTRGPSNISQSINEPSSLDMYQVEVCSCEGSNGRNGNRSVNLHTLVAWNWAICSLWLYAHRSSSILRCDQVGKNCGIFSVTPVPRKETRSHTRCCKSSAPLWKEACGHTLLL